MTVSEDKLGAQFLNAQKRPQAGVRADHLAAGVCRRPSSLVIKATGEETFPGMSRCLMENLWTQQVNGRYFPRASFLIGAATWNERGSTKDTIHLNDEGLILRPKITM
jgi:hypothetical protein